MVVIQAGAPRRVPVEQMLAFLEELLRVGAQHGYPPTLNLNELMQAAFSFPAERLVLSWPTEPFVTRVLLCYKYDLSVVSEDILTMIETLTRQVDGRHEASFFSDSFTAIWKLEWSGDALKIDAEWNTVAADKRVLATRPLVELSKADFLSEWKRPLEVILQAVSIPQLPAEAAPEVERVTGIIRGIPTSGVLYRD